MPALAPQFLETMGRPNHGTRFVIALFTMSGRRHGPVEQEYALPYPNPVDP